MFGATAFDIEFWLVAVIFGIFFFVFFLFAAITHFRGFYDELRYIKDEIKRAGKDERKYWLRQKRRLWLSLIPFVKYR